MKHSSRRDFIQTSGMLLAAAITGVSFTTGKYQPKLSFSTLGCPDWTFEQAIDFAGLHGYTGIELRGILRELDLTKCNEFSSADTIAATRKKMKDKGLKFVDLGSSCNLHISDAAERKKNLDEGKKFIDLAQQLDCPFIRVFPNNFPKEQTREASMELMIKGLLELAEHAKGTQVKVLIESHGDLTKTDDLEKVLQGAAHQHTGMIWDVTNMWTQTKESPAAVYNRLKKYIQHTHIKDAKMTGEKIQYCLLGKGEVPIFEAVDILSQNEYAGYYSFEWEKLWHPEIAAPEIALADYPSAMKQHFQ